MEGPRVVLLIVLLLFIFFTPDQPVRRRGWLDTERFKQERQRDVDVITNSAYGDFNPQHAKWLNLTGFRENDTYAWDLLPVAQDLSREKYVSTWLRSKERAVYHDLNGEVRGRFSKSSLSHDQTYVNLTLIDPEHEYFTDQFERNVTDSEGEVVLALTETDKPEDGYPREVKISLSIESESAPGSGWQANLMGVHFVESGVIIASTSSGKFDAIPALPQFSLYDADYRLAQTTINKTVNSYWDKALTEPPGIPLFSSPNCEMLLWLQAKPVIDSKNGRQYLLDIEKELQYPDGAPTGEAPPMVFSAVIFSPDCGYILEADTVFGPKLEVYWTLVRRLLIAYIIIIGLQIVLLKRQMEQAATPSTRSRISYQTIGMEALGDGLILFALIALLMIEQSAFLMFASAAFLSCVHVAFLEVKFVFDIWTVQVGDPARAEQQRRQRTAPTAAAPTSTAPPAPTSADGTLGLPLPATAPRPEGATPIIIASDQDTELAGDVPSARASFAAIYSKFYFSLVILMSFRSSPYQSGGSLYQELVSLLSIPYGGSIFHRSAVFSRSLLHRNDRRSQKSPLHRLGLPSTDLLNPLLNPIHQRLRLLRRRLPLPLLARNHQLHLLPFIQKLLHLLQLQLHIMLANRPVQLECFGIKGRRWS